jgi:hypothetical protein
MHIAKGLIYSKLTPDFLNLSVLHVRYDNKVQQWTEISVWFDDVGISAFHSYVVVNLWQPLSEWCL